MTGTLGIIGGSGLYDLPAALMPRLAAAIATNAGHA